jgi:hypothetical protein
MSLHPDWPPICLGMVRLYAAEPVTAGDVEIIRSMMRDLVGHPELEEAKRLEIEATRRAGVEVRPRSAVRPSAPAAPRAEPRPQVSPPRRPESPVAQGVFW